MKKIDLIIGVVVSAGLHGGVLWGGEFLSQKKTHGPAVAAEEQQIVAAIEMPAEEEEKLKNEDENTSQDENQTEASESESSPDFAAASLPEPISSMGVSDITTVIKPSQAVAPKAESTNWAPPAKQTRKIDTSKFADFVDISKLDKRPSPVFRADPQYPSEMKRSGIGGHVVLECIVASDGSAQDAMAVSSTNQEFEKPAVDALLKWRFQPGMKDGRKRSTKVRLTINFTPPS